MKRTILITGARSGIGRDAALALAGRGHKVIATTHRAESVAKLEREAKSAGLSLTCAKLDILEPADRAAAVRWIPDVLINNAAIGETGPLAEIPITRVQNNFETNIFATLALTQEIVKDMLKKNSGRIINISSGAGKVAFPYFGAYCMTKFALEAASDALRRELARHGIHVSLIEPGAIDTGFNERMIEKKYEWFNDSSLLANDLSVIKRYEKAIVNGQTSTRSVIKVIIRAVEARRPKSRYVAPRKIGPSLFLARLLPDRVIDRFL